MVYSLRRQSEGFVRQISAFAVALIFAGCVASEDHTASVTQHEDDEGQQGPDGKEPETFDHWNAGVAAAAASNGIIYHGGPVLRGTVNAYYIWYGNWSGNTATTILTDMISNFGPSP